MGYYTYNCGLIGTGRKKGEGVHNTETALHAASALEDLRTELSKVGTAIQGEEQDINLQLIVIILDITAMKNIYPMVMGTCMIVVITLFV